MNRHRDEEIARDLGRTKGFLFLSLSYMPFLLVLIEFLELFLFEKDSKQSRENISVPASEEPNPSHYIHSALYMWIRPYMTIPVAGPSKDWPQNACFFFAQEKTT